MSSDDFDTEPIPGLPERPSQGEKILWQGGPSAWGVARRVLHMDLLAVYFAVLIVWRAGNLYSAGASIGSIGAGLAVDVALAAAALAILALIARAIARSTIYTITSKRVAMRFGVALPITYNLPYAKIQSVGVREYGDRSGDLPIRLEAGTRLAYAVLWPHVRPWRLRAPEPMLRIVPDCRRVAAILGEALAAHAGEAKWHVQSPARVPAGIAAEAATGNRHQEALLAAG